MRHWWRSAGGAAAAGGGAPGHDQGRVFVTVDFEDLKTRSGAGSTITGQLLGMETIRRIACDAMIIPVVLGTGSEVLDVGRARRLFTPGLLRALWLRDRGCTIPGCTAPPFWADAHHLIHWVDGGVTSLLNGALLCGRHHTIAHQQGLDRNRHHQRSDLAPLTTQPHSPPEPAGLQACRQPIHDLR